MTIKPGDVVRLASGGPAMTVADVNGDDAVCCWFADNFHRETRFPVAALARVEPGRDDDWVAHARAKRAAQRMASSALAPVVRCGHDESAFADARELRLLRHVAEYADGLLADTDLASGWTAGHEALHRAIVRWREAHPFDGTIVSEHGRRIIAKESGR